MRTEPKPAETPKTLEAALDRLRSDYSRCDHEHELRIEIVGEVERLLREYGLLEALAPVAIGRCGFCASQELRIIHKSYCIEQP